MFMFCLFQMNSALEKLEQSVSEMTALYSGQEGTCISVAGKILPQFQYQCSALSDSEYLFFPHPIYSQETKGNSGLNLEYTVYIHVTYNIYHTSAIFRLN